MPRSGQVLTDGWTSVRSRGRVVYYHLALPDGSRLAVLRRVANGDGWEWRHYPRDYHPERDEVLASGRVRGSASAARLIAEQEVNR